MVMPKNVSYGITTTAAIAPFLRRAMTAGRLRTNDRSKSGRATAGALLLKLMLEESGDAGGGSERIHCPTGITAFPL